MLQLFVLNEQQPDISIYFESGQFDFLISRERKKKKNTDNNKPPIFCHTQMKHDEEMRKEKD